MSAMRALLTLAQERWRDAFGASPVTGAGEGTKRRFARELSTRTRLDRLYARTPNQPQSRQVRRWNLRKGN